MGERREITWTEDDDRQMANLVRIVVSYAEGAQVAPWKLLNMLAVSAGTVYATMGFRPDGADAACDMLRQRMRGQIDLLYADLRAASGRSVQ